ncbi:redoxin domain-containing protein [Streptomyces sp. Ru73]|uniref:TlpA family protein disulfide reductase n=1 Tax=Streptomyces sp. Ru73 TaxID=2080748 RepID=UPI000CDD2A41|nr:TlpA disulfide reductase family protein [Streptomyces sp. Ru73]POX41915.1 redoxin domain-containing protein [Streptomyces sp. Ru73]
MTPRSRPGTRPAVRGLTALLAACAAASTLSGCADEHSTGGSRAGTGTAGHGFDAFPAAERAPAPGIQGTTTRGTPLDVGDYKGKKAVVLNIWGSWCGPCDAEAPGFAKVAGESRSKGVQFVGINTRDSGTAQAIRFEEQHKLPFPSLFDPSGKLMLRIPKGSINPQFIPSTVVIDRRGRIAARAMGPLGEQQLREMLKPVIAEGRSGNRG